MTKNPEIFKKNKILNYYLTLNKINVNKEIPTFKTSISYDIAVIKKNILMKNLNSLNKTKGMKVKMLYF